MPDRLGLREIGVGDSRIRTFIVEPIDPEERARTHERVNEGVAAAFKEILERRHPGTRWTVRRVPDDA